MTTDAEAWAAHRKACFDEAAAYLEATAWDTQDGPKWKALRTLGEGEEPCIHCGYPIPEHDESCVAKGGA